jgi:hypothetical protein
MVLFLLVSMLPLLLILLVLLLLLLMAEGIISTILRLVGVVADGMLLLHRLVQSHLACCYFSVLVVSLYLTMMKYED